MGEVDCWQTAKNRRQTEASKDPVHRDEEKLDQLVIWQPGRQTVSGPGLQRRQRMVRRRKRREQKSFADLKGLG